MFLFTSEAVGCGHPDSVADTIADALVEEYVKKEPYARTSIEVLIKGNKVIIAGEVTSNDPLSSNEIVECVRQTVKKIGYGDSRFEPKDTLHYADVEVEIVLTEQSSEIALGMNKEDIGANDQGIILGYAERSNVYPQANGRALTVALAQDLAMRLYKLAKLPDSIFGIDIKTQVTLDFYSYENYEYAGNLSAPSVESIVVAIPTIREVGREKYEKVVKRIIDELFAPIDSLIYKPNEVNFHINSTGSYHSHGPLYDTGLCFEAGTLVHMHDGSTKPIEEIKVGDKVKSYNLEKGLVVNSEVSDTLEKKSNSELVEIELEDNSKIRTTANHLFFTEEDGWVKACDLNPSHHTLIPLQRPMA